MAPSTSPPPFSRTCRVGAAVFNARSLQGAWVGMMLRGQLPKEKNQSKEVS